MCKSEIILYYGSKSLWQRSESSPDHWLIGWTEIARNGLEAHITPVTRRIFIGLLGESGGLVSTKDLANRVYEADPDGGPLEMVKCMHQFLSRQIKPILRIFDFECIREGHRGYIVCPRIIELKAAA